MPQGEAPREEQQNGHENKEEESRGLKGLFNRMLKKETTQTNEEIQQDGALPELAPIQRGEDLPEISPMQRGEALPELEPLARGGDLPDIAGTQGEPAAQQDKEAEIEERRRLKERLQQEALEQANRVKVKNHHLYKTYCRYNGIYCPQDDEDAVFNLSIFTEEKKPADKQQREWLASISRGLALLPVQDAENPKPQDGQAYINISSDRLSAWLFIMPAEYGGQNVTADGIAKQLAGMKVTEGLDWGKIYDACNKEQYFKLFKIAEGIPPIDGIDGEIIEFFRRDNSIRLEVKEDDTIDYRNLGWLQTAEEGDVICEIVPAVPPQDGKSVLGDVLRGKPGKQPVPPRGEGTALNADGTALIAQRGGAVSFYRAVFRVDPLLIVDGDVNAGIGNINMKGDVIVKGDIKDGFEVRASGNVTVQGRVDAAQVEAGGRIQIGYGMNGSLRGTLQAGQDIICKFLENADVECCGKIVADSIVNSNVMCDDSVEVTTGRGAIIGGSFSVLNTINAKSIGNNSNRPIDIVLGNTIAFMKEWQETREKRTQTAQELSATEKNLMFLKIEGGATMAERRQAGDMEISRTVQSRHVGMLDKRLKLMSIKAENRDGCRIFAEEIFPPMHVTIGGREADFKQELKHAEIGFADGEVKNITLSFLGGPKQAPPQQAQPQQKPAAKKERRVIVLGGD